MMRLPEIRLPNRKYLAFSEKAAADGFTSIAMLYKAASEGEAIHAII